MDGNFMEKMSRLLSSELGYGLISDDATWQKACGNLNDRSLDLPCCLQATQHSHQALHQERRNPQPSKTDPYERFEKHHPPRRLPLVL